MGVWTRDIGMISVVRTGVQGSTILTVPLFDSSSVVNSTEPAAPTAANSMGITTPFFRPNL